MNKRFWKGATALAVAAALGAPASVIGANPFGATYNYKGGVLNGKAEGMEYGPEKFCVAEVKLDFAAIAAARTAAGQAALASADVLNLVNVYAGIYVPWVGLQVTTVEGGTATVDIGDVTTPNGFLDDISINALGRSASLVTTAYSVAVGGGKWFNADTTIDMLLNNNSIDVAVVKVFVAMCDMRSTKV